MNKMIQSGINSLRQRFNWLRASSRLRQFCRNRDSERQAVKDRMVLPGMLLAFAIAWLGSLSLTTVQTFNGSVSAATSSTGILLMAHGGSKDWNKQVLDVVAEVNKQMPTEVAFGMADRATLQEGINKLTERGVTKIVAVPLFVSSYSSVIECTKYLLGLRPDPPKELADFAMAPMPDMLGMTDHLAAGASTPEPPALPTPVKSALPLEMRPALDQHAIVAQILTDRATAIAKDPPHDVLILVAHGPNDDKENAKWLANMNALAKQIGTHTAFARIDCVTLRDDADAPVRDKATAELRNKVQSADDAGYHALIVPLLLSYGGIEEGLRQRLDGLEHTLSPQALLPDPRIAEWVLASAQGVETQ